MNFFTIFMHVAIYFESNGFIKFNNETSCSNQFKCHTYGSCIKNYKHCDGIRHCDNKSDEAVSSNEKLINKLVFKTPSQTVLTGNVTFCGENQIMCSSGMCVQSYDKCDGPLDCEQNLCKSNSADRKLSPSYCNPFLISFNHLNFSSETIPQNNFQAIKHSYKKIAASKAISSDGCFLPQIPDGGTYQIYGCKTCTWKPGDWVPFNTVIKYSCSESYISSTKYSRSYCFKVTGSWDPEPPACLRTCKGLISNTLNLECFYKMSNISCSNRVIAGTILRPSCKSQFLIADPTTAFRETQCLPDGSWEQELFQCKVYCGKSYVNNKNVTVQPWIASIYAEESFSAENNTVVPECLGILISHRAVLAAASCRRKNVRYVDFVILNTVSFYLEKSEYEKNKRKIIRIIIHPQYVSFTNQLLFDLAILVLDKSVAGEKYLMPICLGSNTINTNSRITAWYETESNHSINLITHEAIKQEVVFCRHRVTNKLKLYLTIGAFNARFRPDGKSLLVNNGASFSISSSGYHYLVGIAGTNGVQDCKDNSNYYIIVFTSVKYYLNWISSIIEITKLRANISTCNSCNIPG